MTPDRPPRALTRTLLAVLRRDSGEEIAGDLHEEFVAFGHRRGAARARLWYAGQVLHIGSRAMIRLVRRRPRGTDPQPPPGPNPGDSVMRSLLTDARHAVRMLVKRPALSALVVTTLSLGLGA